MRRTRTRRMHRWLNWSPMSRTRHCPPTTAFTAVTVPATGAASEQAARFFCAVSTAIWAEVVLVAGEAELAAAFTWVCAVATCCLSLSAPRGLLVLRLGQCLAVLGQLALRGAECGLELLVGRLGIGVGLRAGQRGVVRGHLVLRRGHGRGLLAGVQRGGLLGVHQALVGGGCLVPGAGLLLGGLRVGGIQLRLRHGQGVLRVGRVDGRPAPARRVTCCPTAALTVAMGPLQFCALMTVVLAGETFPLAVATADRSALLTARVRETVAAAACGTPETTQVGATGQAHNGQADAAIDEQGLFEHALDGMVHFSESTAYWLDVCCAAPDRSAHRPGRVIGQEPILLTERPQSMSTAVASSLRSTWTAHNHP